MFWHHKIMNFKNCDLNSILYQFLNTKHKILIELSEIQVGWSLELISRCSSIGKKFSIYFWELRKEFIWSQLLKYNFFNLFMFLHNVYRVKQRHNWDPIAVKIMCQKRIKTFNIQNRILNFEINNFSIHIELI